MTKKELRNAARAAAESAARPADGIAVVVIMADLARRRVVTAASTPNAATTDFLLASAAKGRPS